MKETGDNIFRMTKRRKIILQKLQDCCCHPTAEQVYEMVKTELPKISLGTVYRNLEVLSESGMIRKLEGGPQRRYDGDLEFHHHIRCIRCGCVEDSPVDPKGDLTKDIKEKTDFEILGYKVEFFGLCPDCQKAKHNDC